MRRACILFLILSALFAMAAWGQKADEGFVPLFNGKNLDGWANVNCAPETFTVRDEIIICTGLPTGVMRTDKQYENYILDLEWRHLKESGNAGLFVHSAAIPVRGQPFTRSVEVQVMDGDEGSVFAIQGGTMASPYPHPKGWSRALPLENKMMPTGMWNHYRVVCRDGTLALEINGRLVNRAFHTNPRKGYICLESEGSEVHFRNIRIKELPGSKPPPPAAVVGQPCEGFRSLYNGLDLRGWKMVPGHEGHWKANDWILEYDGKSQAEGDKALWTEEEFGDFKLIVDWRFPGPFKYEKAPIILPDGSYALDQNGNQETAVILDGGDSGIYLRGMSKSQINIWQWPVGSGEIWGYRLDKEMSAEVRAGATPILNADRPVGQWNRYEITMVGDRVTVVLNGKTVIDNARLPGIPKRGPVALQHHGDSVQFANIYIKELD
ncbi:MAG: DUF1080 domain-containing protein [Gemmatimonadota bacterium]|nr:DUF1080 domain-containing protein [Gemmatimonadota bacterium]